MKKSKLLMIILSLVVVSAIFAGLKNGQRFFKSEVDPKSEAEKVILESFKVDISDEYDKYNDLYINDVGNNPEGSKKNFKEGLYTKQITIHSLKKLTKEEYTNKSNGSKYYPYMERLNKLNPIDFEIIEVNYTIKFTDKLNKIAQWGNGDWVRYYVVVKQNANVNWKILEVYGHL